MKILKIIGISLAVLVILIVVACVIFIKTFDINRFKPQIIAQAKAVLSRDIDFERARLDISLRRGINVKVSNLSIADDRQFQQGDFLKVKKVSISLDVMGYLLQKKITLPAIYIDNPQITVIRGKDGLINAAMIGKKPGNEPSTEVSSSSTPTPPAMALPAVLISSFRIEGGKITYIDKSFDPAVCIDVNNISMLVTGISLNEPFPFKVDAAVLSQKKNISINGNIRLNLAANEVEISGLNVSAELSDIDIAKLPAAFPMIKDAPLPQDIKGRINARFDTLKAGPEGLKGLSAIVTLSGAGFKVPQLAAPVTGMSADVKLTQSDAILDKASLSIGSGTIECSGELKDYVAAQKYNMALNISNLSIGDLLLQDKASFRAEGIISGTITATGAGFSPEAVKSNMSATADIFISHAKLVGLNVLRTVLDKITVIPGLSASVEAGLPAELKEKLVQEDTEFSDMILPVSIEAGRMFIKNTSVGTGEFVFTGLAEAGFDGSYALQGAFIITQAMSEAMVSAVSQLQYLYDEKKQIYIPLKVSGTPAGMKFNVDLEYIGKKLLENQAKFQIFKAIDKALGVPAPEEGNGEGTQNQGTSSDSVTAAKEAIGSIIGNIFKNKK